MTPRDAKKETEKHLQCVRCCQAHNQSRFPIEEFPIENVAAVMEAIPPTAHIVYVVSATDFPMSVLETVFRYRPAHKMQFVVTKTDLLFAENKTAARTGQRFFADYLHRMYKVPPENVHCVSSTNDWNTAKFFRLVRHDSYFIGCTNSGKSTLVQALLHAAHEHRQSLPNAKRDRKEQKLADGVLARGYSQTRKRIADIAKYKASVGPGALYMPGFTRGFLPFDLTPTVSIHDAPGFAPGGAAHLHQFISKDDLKKLIKGTKVYRTGMYDSHYELAKLGQVVTVGGLFFMEVPNDTMYQVRNCINHKVHVFGSLDKALRAWREQHEANASVFVVDPRVELERFIVPSFYGPIDLVLRSIGHVTITPTGAKRDSEPLVVHLPKGMDALVRQPLVPYITKTITRRDARGNRLRKENWVSKSVKEFVRFTGKTPFATGLVRHDGGSDAEFLEAEVRRIKGTAAAHGSVDETTKYANWVKPQGM